MCSPALIGLGSGTYTPKQSSQRPGSLPAHSHLLAPSPSVLAPHHQWDQFVSLPPNVTGFCLFVSFQILPDLNAIIWVWQSLRKQDAEQEDEKGKKKASRAAAPWWAPERCEGCLQTPLGPSSPGASSRGACEAPLTLKGACVLFGLSEEEEEEPGIVL